jgi:hypothetical protein
MLAVQRRLDDEGMTPKAILQAHDELVLEVPDGEPTAVREQLPRRLGGIARLAVPLAVGGAPPHSAIPLAVPGDFPANAGIERGDGTPDEAFEGQAVFRRSADQPIDQDAPGMEVPFGRGDDPVIRDMVGAQGDFMHQQSASGFD